MSNVLPWPGTVEGMVLAPGGSGTVQFMPERLFKGRRIVNQGDSDKLVITCVFVANAWQPAPGDVEWPQHALYEVPLGDIEWDLDNCYPGLCITVQLQNKSKEPRRVLFELHGDWI